MRNVRAVRMLLVAFVVAVLALVVAASASGYRPGISYPWAQPGSVAVSSVPVQTPAWIPIGPAPVTTMTPALLGSAYHWVQPPAEIPAG